MFSTTVTLQGQKTIITEPDETNTTIYEAAWYFRPIYESQQYTVMFIGESSSKKIYTGSASPETGDANYHAEESDEEYDHVKLIYETGTLTVPIVEK